VSGKASMSSIATMWSRTERTRQRLRAIRVGRTGRGVRARPRPSPRDAGAGDACRGGGVGCGIGARASGHGRSARSSAARHPPSSAPPLPRTCPSGARRWKRCEGRAERCRLTRQRLPTFPGLGPGRRSQAAWGGRRDRLPWRRTVILSHTPARRTGHGRSRPGADKADVGAIRSR
jgi:hypothetical protein